MLVGPLIRRRSPPDPRHRFRSCPLVGVSKPASMRSNVDLAASRTAEQAEQFASINVERDVVHGDKITEFLGDLLDPYVGLLLGVLPGFEFDLAAGLGHHLSHRVLPAIPSSGKEKPRPSMGGRGIVC